jgi:hypothetical protein
MYKVRLRNVYRFNMINVSLALDNLRTIRAAVDRLQDLSLQQSLLDLQGQLLTIQVAVLEQQVENRTLQNELSRLEECRETDRKLERVFGAYMVVDGPRDRRGPYCVSCWDNKQVLQALVDAGDTAVGYCPSCKSEPVVGPIDASRTAARIRATPLMSAAI